MMNDDILEDSHIDDKERMKLNSYNINKEKSIGTLENFRWSQPIMLIPVLSDVMTSFYFSKKLEDNLLCRCEGHKTQRCSEMCTKVYLLTIIIRGFRNKAASFGTNFGKNNVQLRS